MKILIVDDEVRRYARLLPLLEPIGVARDAVEIVPSADDARERLQRVKYDLMILDILLPRRPEGDPDAKNSLDLLFELHEDDEYLKPGKIVGITADMEVAVDARRNFENYTWTIVEFSAINDSWITSIKNCVQYMEGERQRILEETPQSLVDLAIVCALFKPELEEVLKLPWNWSGARPVEDQTFVHDGYFEVEGRRVSVCAVASARMGMVASALVSSVMIGKLRPRLLAMCGICAGVGGKVEIGNVLLSDPAWDFQSGKRTRDDRGAKFAISPHHLPVASLIRAHIEQVRDDFACLDEVTRAFGSDAPRPIRVRIGPVGSGSAVLADGELIEEIRSQHRDLVGIEMEGYGLYAAAASASAPAPLAFCLKAVCDFADTSKNDDFQRFAAYASAAVLRILMERFAGRLLSHWE